MPDASVATHVERDGARGATYGFQRTVIGDPTVGAHIVDRGLDDRPGRPWVSEERRAQRLRARPRPEQDRTELLRHGDECDRALIRSGKVGIERRERLARDASGLAPRLQRGKMRQQAPPDNRARQDRRGTTGAEGEAQTDGDTSRRQIEMAGRKINDDKESERRGVKPAMRANLGCR